MAKKSGTASYASVFKTEVSRIARKEVRQLVSPILKTAGTRRHDVAALKREVETLKKQIARLSKRALPSPIEKNVEELESKTGRSAPRFRREGLITLRKRLDLSAQDFGRLIGVSALSIYSWESGKAHPRRAQVVKLAAVRHIGKKEAAERLQGA